MSAPTLAAPVPSLWKRLGRRPRRLLRAAAKATTTRLVACARCAPAALWVLQELRRGRVGTSRDAKVLFHLRRLGAGGYYHNVKVSDLHSTHSISGRRANRPLADPSYEAVLWSHIRQVLSRELHGLKVVDIGPAEGYFALEAAKAGAAVSVVHPPHDFLRRLDALAEYFGVRDRITILRGYYPVVGADAVRGADVILCLGLLYHLYDLVQGLEPMIRSQATLVIEGMFYEDDVPRDEKGYARGFDPIGHRENGLVCARWLHDYLTGQGLTVTWIGAWQEFVERPGNRRHAATRKLGVATRTGANVTKAVYAAANAPQGV